MKHLPYKDYKNSGIEWIGDIPESWAMEKLKYTANIFASNVDKKTIEGQRLVSLCNYTDVYYNERIESGMDFMAASATDEQIVKFCLKKNDVIITKDSETPDDIGIAAYVPEDMAGVICGYHLSMIRPKNDVSGAFIKRFFDSHYVKSKFETLANGVTRYGLGSYAIDNLAIPLPPYEEQQAIANFLDRETAKIDELIQKQEELIELIEEERKAIIDQTISRGLNKERELKNSGLTWLGEIPKHWNVKPLKYLISFNDDVLPESTADDYEINYVEVGDVSERFGIANSTEVAFKDAASRARRLVKHGDILISTVRTYLRAIAPVVNPPSNMVVSTGFAVIRPKNLNNDYARFLLSTEYFLSEVISRSTGVSYPAINASDLVQIKVPVPPIEEQGEIAEFIQSKYRTMDLLISKSESSIKFLKEHRASLISAAVTGKIDIRSSINGN